MRFMSVLQKLVQKPPSGWHYRSGSTKITLIQRITGKCLKRGMNLQKGIHTIIIPGLYSGMELAPIIVQ